MASATTVMSRLLMGLLSAIPIAAMIGSCDLIAVDNPAPHVEIKENMTRQLNNLLNSKAMVKGFAGTSTILAITGRSEREMPLIHNI
jgi:hypothetical protein